VRSFPPLQPRFPLERDIYLRETHNINIKRERKREKERERERKRELF